MGAKRNAYISVGKFDCKRPVRKLTMDLKKIGWIHLAQDRDQWRSLLNTVIILRFL